MTDTQRSIKNVYYKQMMKMENIWKKWKGHAAIKLKKTKSESKNDRHTKIYWNAYYKQMMKIENNWKNERFMLQ